MSATHHKPTHAETLQPRAFGLLAEFEDVDTLLHAARGVRNRGYRQWDCFSPFPVHGLNRAMGLRHTRLPWIVLIAGLTGAITGIGLQMYTMEQPIIGALHAIFQGYGYIISGKPYQSGPAFIPVIFELTILLSAFGAFFGMIFMNKLPRLYHPLFRSERFRRVTTDRFFIAVEAEDPVFDWKQTRELLSSLGATHVEELED